jgi:ubiquinone/menaquinone biosynthesis C-methylase UbiE
VLRSVVEPPMRAYYEARSAEYDDWWLGRGLFASRERPGWAAEVEALIATLEALAPARLLDVACGTGFLTAHLPGEVVGLDQSPAMLEIAARRLPSSRLVAGEAVPLPFADAEFERVFTGHFYGHLRPAERVAFLGEAARVAGELVVVDSALRPGGPAEEYQQRLLSDGSRHRVYKRWFAAEELAAELGGGRVLHAGEWFVAVAHSAGR